MKQADVVNLSWAVALSRIQRKCTYLLCGLSCSLVLRKSRLLQVHMVVAYKKNICCIQKSWIIEEYGKLLVCSNM